MAIYGGFSFAIDGITHKPSSLFLLMQIAANRLTPSSPASLMLAAENSAGRQRDKAKRMFPHANYEQHRCALEKSQGGT